MRYSIIAKWEMGQSDEVLALAEPAFLHLKGNIQTGYSSFEAGGPLFAIRDGRTNVIVAAAGPFLGDERRRHFFRPLRSKTQSEIDRRHNLGEHLIGAWHSHPEKTPHLSSTDVQTMSAVYRASIHDLRAMLMLIIGESSDSTTWHASLHDGNSIQSFNLMED